LLAVLNCYADVKIEEQVAGLSKPLTWADLVNHPERWPAEVKLTVQLKFDGDTLTAGTVVRIDQVTATEVQ